MDGEMVYPSVGMVFELAYLKCRLLCSLRSASGMDGDGELLADLVGRQCADAAAAVGEEEEERELELERQVALLLSVVHRWNPHLLPNLAGPYDVDAGAMIAPPPPSSPPSPCRQRRRRPTRPTAMTVRLRREGPPRRRRSPSRRPPSRRPPSRGRHRRCRRC